MSASDLFKAGKLAEATTEQLAAVKANPTDANRRLFLFELALFSGDIERASRQADLVKFDEAEINATMDQYRLLILGEQLRRRLFRESLAPRSYGPLTEECKKRIEAINLLRDNRPAEAAALIEQHPPQPVSGSINGQPFEGFFDCDDLLGPVLEVCTNNGYFWVPLASVRSLTTTPPKYPRDLYWLPGSLELADGQNGPVFLPTLYPFSHENADEAVKLGRKTDWTGGEGSPVCGAGQKTFLAGDDAIGILDIRDLTINASTA